MVAQFSGKLYKSQKITPEEFQDKLASYNKSFRSENIADPLIERVAEFAVSAKRVRFFFYYDHVIPINVHDETRLIIGTSSAKVYVSDPPSESIYIIRARASVADSVRVRLSRALANDEDFIQPIHIPPKVLKYLQKNDSIEIKYGWWDGIETYARKGALKGNLLKSKYYSEFSKSGEPTSLTFESVVAGRTIRITSKGSITFYGTDVKVGEVEKYVRSEILKRI